MGNALLCCDTERPGNQGVDQKRERTPEKKKDKKDKKDKKKKNKKEKRENWYTNDDDEEKPRKSLHDIEEVTFKDRKRFEPIVSDDEDQEDQSVDPSVDQKPLRMATAVSSKRNSRTNTPVGRTPSENIFSETRSKEESAA